MLYFCYSKNMTSKAKPTYVVEVPLDTTPHDERRLAGVFEAAKRLYNAVLQSGLDILDSLRNDPQWEAARRLPNKTKEAAAARGAAFSAVRTKHGFTEYSLQRVATSHKNAAGFSDRIGSNITQKIGTRVFKALDEYLYGARGKPRFKGVKRPLHSIEGKNTAAAPRWNSEIRVLSLESGWDIRAKKLDLEKDEWRWSALRGKLKYTRVLWRAVGASRRYFVQLVFAGEAPQKASLLARRAPVGTQGGLDLGPSTFAWVTSTDAGLERLADGVDTPQREIRRLQRKLDRQNRANNPDNFDEKGRAKRGRTWVKSKSQQNTQQKLSALHSCSALRRAHAHGVTLNQLLSRALHYRHDGVSVKSLQKNYGRSVGARAPGLFMSELQRKAARAGGKSETVNVWQLRTSQYDHSTGQFVKKKLSERWHIFGDGRGRAQRDVYSAFLALHAVDSVDTDGVVAWSHDRERLEAAWVVLEPALLAKELFRPNGSRSTSQGDRISLGVDSCQASSSKVSASRRAPGRRARRAAHAKNSMSTTV